MLPRRTRRSTSRTAKKPANSLVNPWVSRMNSSANQSSPLSPRAKSRSRAANFCSHRQVLPGRPGKSVPDRPPPERNMPSTGPVTQGAKLGIGLREYGCEFAISRIEGPSAPEPHSDRRRDRVQLASHFLGVDFRLEADHQFAAEIEHRPLDHRGLRQHQGECLTLAETFLVAIRQFAKSGARAIEQR